MTFFIFDAKIQYFREFTKFSVSESGSAAKIDLI